MAIEKMPSKPAVSIDALPDTLDTKCLFKDRKQLVILHDGVPYTLRITSNNKLILTK